MSPRTFRPSTSIVRSARRQTQWLGRDFDTAPVLLGSSSVILDSVLTVAEKALLPFTIVRTVGTLACFSDQITLREEGFGALGVAVVSEQATAAGVASVPNPVTDVASDLWFQYMTWMCGYQVSGTPASAQGNSLNVFPFDSKGQRKVPDGGDIAVVLANSSAAAGIEYILNMRILVKLH